MTGIRRTDGSPPARNGKVALAARLATVASGVWLMASPAVLGYAGIAHDDHRTIGPFIAGFAFVAIWEVVAAVRWAAMPLGAWLLVSPFVLGYASGAETLSGMLAGIVAIVATIPGKGRRERFGGGWRSLVGPPDRVAAGD